MENSQSMNIPTHITIPKIFLYLTATELIFGIVLWLRFDCIATIAPTSAVALTTSKPPREVVLVKVGGSSITNKATKETLNESALEWFTETISVVSKELSISFVVVHGAGSFGHHTAKKFGLQGKTQAPSSEIENDSTSRNTVRSRQMQGLSETRQSVQKLNQVVVSAFIQRGISAIGISPCFGVPGMQAHGGDDFAQQQLQEIVYTAVQAGLVPVLHGDACLYGDEGGVGILSGDVLMEILGRADWVSHAVFLTDVDGVYTADPNTDPTAVLIPTILVDTETGELPQDIVLDASGSTHAHDVTGGLQAKLKSARAIAMAGKNVTIAKCLSSSGMKAIQGNFGEMGTSTIVMPRCLAVHDTCERYET